MEINRYRLPGLERRYLRQPLNTGYLIILQTERKPSSFFEESLGEIRELTRSCEIREAGFLTAKVPQPSPSHFLREGKLNEVRELASRTGANVLVFNVDLSPGQGSNIETFTGIPVLDRTGLILNIFGRRARSKEGKLQVELAQLNYALPRLAGLGGVMSRLGGGIGGRGPGEQELERDRRKIRLRIQRVREELARVERHRQLIRSGRKKKNFVIVAIIGYTNAGKSTLLNALTGAQARVADKMFATLDPLARMESLQNGRKVLFVDTVGFLRDLPHTLIESFHATLEEVTEADILIHVLDVSSPKAAELKSAVEKVLQDIQAGSRPVILALNKVDLLNEDEKKQVKSLWPEGLWISAKEGLGLHSLSAEINKNVFSDTKID